MAGMMRLPLPPFSTAGMWPSAVSASAMVAAARSACAPASWLSVCRPEIWNRRSSAT